MNLNQITVPATDLLQSIRFYEQLGLELIVHNNDHYARFMCPNGQSTFSLHLVENVPVGDGIWVYFELDDLDEQVARLLALGVVFDELPNDKPWLWREAHLKDPANNHLILYFAGDNRLNPPWRKKV
jgi:catechol 2,3-dioxygenase-like lactoylglutathione lyase family enzyme